MIRSWGLIEVSKSKKSLKLVDVWPLFGDWVPLVVVVGEGCTLIVFDLGCQLSWYLLKSGVLSSFKKLVRS